MRHALAAILFALVPLGACASLSSTPAVLIDRGAVMENARRMSERYASTWNAKDMAGFGGLYAADARHVNQSGEFLRGRAAIVTAHRANRERYADSVRMVTRLEGARAITDDTIVAVMIMEIVNDPAQPAAVQATRLTLTLVRRGEDWQIAQAQASAVT